MSEIPPLKLSTVPPKAAPVNAFAIMCDLETPKDKPKGPKTFAKKAKSKIAPLQVTMVEISDDSAPASKAKAKTTIPASF